MQLLLLSLALTCVSAGVITQSSRCGWGPPFWCSSIDHARECQATKHCMDTVWKYTIIKADSTGYCTDCQLVVGALKELLSDKSTQEDITQAAEKACALLPNPDWVDQCKGIVTEYGPELLQMLDNDIDAVTICATVGLCNGLEDRVSPYGVKDSIPSSIAAAPNRTCQDCTRFFKDVQQSITSKETLDSLLQLFNQTLCSQLGSLGDECMDFLEASLPAVLELLADELDPDITCRVFGFCDADSTHKPALQLHLKNIFTDSRKMPLQFRSSEECDICKDVLGQISDLIKDRVTQEKIENFVETEFCGLLGGLAATCKQIVEEYAPMAFELLVNELDPKTLCEYIGVCAVPTLYEVQPIVLETSQSQIASKTVQGKDLCELCKFVVGVLDNLVKENDTEKDLEKKLFDVCERLSSTSLKEQCENYVKTYLPMFFYILSQDLDPSVVCTELSICTAKSVAEKKLMDDSLCVVCEDLVKELELALSNMTKDDLMNDALMVCDYIPIPQYKQMCTEYVKQYAPMLIDLLKSGLDPHTVCALAGVCNQTLPWGEMTKPIPEEPILSSVAAAPSTACEICNTVVIYAGTLLKNNATEAEVLDQLESFCSDLPSFADECKSLVEQYGPQVYKMLLQELTPDVICKELGLCTDLKDKKPAGSVAAAPSTACEICNTIVIYAGTLLKNNATEAEVLEQLESFCSELPSFVDECKSLVEQYGPQVYKMLLQELTPDVICKELDLCTETKEEKPAGSVTAPSTGCEVCTTVVTYAETLLKNNVTEAKFLEQLESYCSDLPSFADDCKSYVQAYGPMVYKMLLQKLTPDAICKVLGLCIDTKEEKPAGSVAAAPSTACEICNTVVIYAGTLLKNNATEAEVLEQLESYCSDLPSFADECKSLVKAYGHLVYKMLMQELTPDVICKVLGLCTDTKMEQPAGSVAAPPSTECLICNTVVIYAETLLKNKASKAEVLQALESFCSELSSFADECKSLVEEYGPQIYDMLMQELTPDVICKGLGFCKDVKEPLTDLPAVVLSPVDTLPLLGDEKAAGSVVAPPSTECLICNTVVIYAETLLKNKASKAEVLQALESFCSELSSFADECKSLVEQYGPQIYDMLVQELTPDVICKGLGFCEAVKEPLTDLPPVVLSPVDTLPLLGDEKAAGSVEGVSSTACEICNTLALYVGMMLKNKETEDDIAAGLEALCNQLPPNMQSQCDAIVEKYELQLINLVVKDLNSACQKIGLCPNVQATVKATSVIMSPYDTLPLVGMENKKEDIFTSPVGCETCILMVNFVKRYIGEEATEDKIQEALDKMCDVLRISECNSLVDQYAKELINYVLLGYSSDAICQEIGLCTRTAPVKTLPEPVHVKLLKDSFHGYNVGSWRADVKILPAEKKAPKPTLEASPTCEICTLVLTSVKKLLGQNSSEAEIKRVLEEVCSKLPTTLSAECKSFVDEYEDLVIKLLLDDLDPQQICQQIGLCSQDTVKAGPQCVVCEFVLKTLDDYLKENSSEADIKRELERVCTLLPTTIATECSTFVSQYGPIIIQMLANEIDPKEICTKIRACTGGVKASETYGKECELGLLQCTGQNEMCLLKSGSRSRVGVCTCNADSSLSPVSGLCETSSAKTVAKVSQPNNIVTCEVCTVVMKYLESMLQDNSSEEAIREALDKVCSYLPASYSSECTAFVNQYADQIIKLLVDELADPATVCAELGLCSQAIAKVSQLSSASCVLCEFVMRELQDVLKDNSSEAAIREALDKVCSYMPETIKAECTSFVNTYAEVIIKLLVNEVDPATICKTIGLCSQDRKTMSMPMSLSKTVQAAVQQGDLTCEACQLICEQIERYLAQGKSEQQIEQLLDQLCDVLPDTVTVQCRAVVKKHVPEIVAMLKKDMDPKVICPALQLCDQKTERKEDDDTLYFKPGGHQKMVGTNKCTYGPAYWCATKQNALDCNAVEHCNRHVWN